MKTQSDSQQEKLDLKQSIAIVILNDDETWSELEGSKLMILDKRLALLAESENIRDLVEAQDEDALKPQDLVRAIECLDLEQVVRFYIERH